MGSIRHGAVGIGLLAGVAFATGVGACGDDAVDAPLASACVINSDCNVPLVCSFGKCHNECETSRDCPPNNRCVAGDKPYRVCQLPEEVDCRVNSDCAGGKICASDKKCRDGCNANRDCIGDQVCVSNVCAEPAELRADGSLPGSDGDGGAAGDTGTSGTSGTGGTSGDGAAQEASVDASRDASGEASTDASMDSTVPDGAVESGADATADGTVSDSSSTDSASGDGTTSDGNASDGSMADSSSDGAAHTDGSVEAGAGPSISCMPGANCSGTIEPTCCVDPIDGALSYCAGDSAECGMKIPYTCDDGADCAPGTICCRFGSTSPQSRCMVAAQCVGEILCTQATIARDCPDTFSRCVNTFPRYSKCSL